MAARLRFPAMSRNLPFLEHRQFSTPILRTVPNVQDFDDFFSGTVHNHIRRGDELAGPLHFSGSAKAGEGCELFNAVDNLLSNIPCCGWIVLLDASNSSFKLVGRLGCPPNQPHD
jgi:hypothetical protein